MRILGTNLEFLQSMGKWLSIFLAIINGDDDDDDYDGDTSISHPSILRFVHSSQCPTETAARMMPSTSVWENRSRGVVVQSVLITAYY